MLEQSKKSDATAVSALLARIQEDRAVVGVIGLGYVGLPLCHALHQGGQRLLGFDIDHEKIDSLARGENYLKHLGSEMAADLGKSARFEGTTDFSRLAETDVVIVCVPTPVGSHQEPDLTYVHDAARAVGEHLHAGQLVILESTSFPGTTRGEVLPILAASRGRTLVAGRDFFLAYSPEREDPGRKTHDTVSIPKLVGGIDADSTRLAAAVYRKGIHHVVEVSTAEVAEAAKLLENIFRSVNIAMVNEMKVILTEMGIDIWEVIEAASTKPFGFMPFFPGPGLGGHCIPIDPFYLSWKAKEVGKPTRFIELAGEINTAMPDYVVERCMLALNERGQCLRGARILVLGLAYKPNVDDTRESPSMVLIEKLQALGADVAYSDPHIPKVKPTRKHDLGLTSRPLDAEEVASYDAVLVATHHDAFDWALIAEHARLVVDTRNALRDFAGTMRGRLVRA